VKVTEIDKIFVNQGSDFILILAKDYIVIYD